MAFINPGATFADGEAICSLFVDSVVNDPSGSIILGGSFLRSAYVVYDLENNEIAIGQTIFNATSSNIKAIPPGTGLPGVSSVATQISPPKKIDRQILTRRTIGPERDPLALW
jgi:hypothetical protein